MYIDGILFSDNQKELIKFSKDWDKEIYVVPDGVEIIADGAFRGSGLKEIILPDSINTIGRNAFNLIGYPFVEYHSIQMPAKAMQIGELAFDPTLYYARSGLKDSNGKYYLRFRFNSIIIPVELLGNWKVNSEEKKLADFIETEDVGRKKSLFEDVKTSGYKRFMAFYLALIHKDAESTKYLFKIRNKLSEDLLYADLVKYLDPNLVKQSNHSSKPIASKRVSLSKWAIKNLPDGSYEIEKYKGKEKIIEIPNEYNGAKITSIGEYAFSPSRTKACDEIEQIIIPEGIRTIKDSAFNGCSKLAEVFLPNSLKTIGKEAFRYCTNLVKINMPDSVMEIGCRSFSSCTQLNEVELPKELKIIPMEMFSYCSGLRRVVMRSSVTIIQRSAFTQCTDLEEIILSDSLQAIEGHAFSTCKKLRRVRLPEGLTEIGSYVFSYCNSLEDVIIPASVIKIDTAIFNKCNKVKVHTPSGSYAEEYCKFWNIQVTTTL